VPNAADEASSDLLTWLRRLAEQPRFGHQDRLGRAHLIDRAARLRGAAAIQDGDVFSMSRPLLPSTHNLRGDSLPGFSVEVFLSERPWWRTASDHQEMEAHGHAFTHLDGLNHMGVDGTWYSGWPATEIAGLSVADFAESGLVTRGVLADIPKVRCTDWVSPDEPVSDADLDRALAVAGVTIEAGDALLLYMGRDRFEAAGNAFPPAEGNKPGIGRRGAGWLAEHDVSVLAWDFMDAHIPGIDPAPSVHMLMWAIGLVIVDSVDYSRVIPRMRADGRSVAQFVVAPLNAPGTTGVHVNPLLVL
jgi:kynurenine formamidase